MRNKIIYLIRKRVKVSKIVKINMIETKFKKIKALKWWLLVRFDIIAYEINKEN